MKVKERKNKSGVAGGGKAPRGAVLVVAQELRFARLLAGNDGRARARVLRALRKWLLNCFQKGYEFKEDDFIRIWKGLFYAVWMSDKPLVQEELCEEIAGTFDLFPAERSAQALLLLKAGLRVLATEWYGIDQHRIDKFLMLARRVLRGALRALARRGWERAPCEAFAACLAEGDGLLAARTPQYARNALSLQLHICDCYLEEISKVSRGELPEESVVVLLRPFALYMQSGAEPRLTAAARRVFSQLLRQSEPGLRYEQRRQAWIQMGCPEGGPDALELVQEDDAGEQEGEGSTAGSDLDDEEAALDPRAGRVDVTLRPLPVAARALAVMLRDLTRRAHGAAHTRLAAAARQFEELAKDSFPLRERAEEAPVLRAKLGGRSRRAAAALGRLEGRLRADDALRGVGRKLRKRLLARARAGESIADELEALQDSARRTTNGVWRVEDAEPATPKPSSRPQTETEADAERARDKEHRARGKRRGSASGGAPPLKRPWPAQAEADGKGQGAEPTVNGDTNVGTKIKKSKKEKVKIVVVDSPAKTLERSQQDGKQQTTSTASGKKTKHDNISDKKTTAIASVRTQDAARKADKRANRLKNYQKVTQAPAEASPRSPRSVASPKRVVFALKNNRSQEPVEYYRSVRRSPGVPFDVAARPQRTNLKPNAAPSPINPFFRNKMRPKAK